MALSLPGLGLEEPDEVQAVQTSHHDLSKGCEWRFEVAEGKYVNVKLRNGSAEIFGTELVINNSYTFTGTKAALFSWHGCSIEVSGDACQSEYTAEETPMNDYINVHFALETLRDNARVQGREGPRTLVLGPENAGKTSLAKILTGYAVRGAKAPLVVNLDNREGVLSVPGTLTATVFKSLVDVEDGWGSAPMSGPNGIIPVKLPLVYYYGMPKPEDRGGTLYKALVSRMALAVTGRLQQDPEARETGIIVDTPGSLTSSKNGASIGYEIIQHIVSEFAITAIICLGSERLYNDIVRRFDNAPIAVSNAATTNQASISVIKLAKSGGCVDRDESFMKSFRAAQIRSYFYGNPKLTSGISLGPRSQPVDFSQLSVYRLVGTNDDADYGTGAGSGGGDEFLPGGLDNDDFYGASNTTSSKVPLPASQIFERLASAHPAMRSCVLAVLNCDPEAEQDELRSSSVMGFLYVVDVDEAKQRVILLAPVAGRIPARAIVWGGWPEAVLGIAS